MTIRAKEAFDHALEDCERHTWRLTHSERAFIEGIGHDVGYNRVVTLEQRDRVCAIANRVSEATADGDRSWGT
jgi:hypothetical protein